jgi:hypothetical protein
MLILLCLQDEVQALGLPLKLWMVLRQSVQQEHMAAPAIIKPEAAASNCEPGYLQQQKQQQPGEEHAEPQQQRPPRGKGAQSGHLKVDTAAAAGPPPPHSQGPVATPMSMSAPAPVRVRKHALKNREPFHLKVCINWILG